MSRRSLNGFERPLVLLYGLVAYATFLFTILYAIGFVGNLWLALGLDGSLYRSMDVPTADTSFARALLVNVALLALFAVQHSGMARKGFKDWSARVLPQAIERSTFVLTASVCLCLLFWYWQPIGTAVLWDVSTGRAGAVLTALSIVGWAIVFMSTFMIDHFELFGLRQVWYAFRAKESPELPFKTPGFYKLVRHPIYVGFIIAFWATPIVTLGHLLFAATTTLYILGAIQLEERDLVDRYGDLYRRYRERVRMLAPWPRHSGSTPDSTTPESFKPVS
jgi:protein-S-isoprenylcysteine O-methyltransferase Ste14